MPASPSAGHLQSCAPVETKGVPAIGVAVAISAISAYEPSRANDVAALRHKQQVQCQSQHAVA